MPAVCDLRSGRVASSCGVRACGELLLSVLGAGVLGAGAGLALLSSAAAVLPAMSTFPPIPPAEESTATYRNADSLERGSNALADAQRTAAQTADIGTSILTQLGSQREQLISARSSMQGANQQLADARKNITTMFRRATTKKCIIYGIIIGLCGTIVLVLISKFSRR